MRMPPLQSQSSFLWCGRRSQQFIANTQRLKHRLARDPAEKLVDCVCARDDVTRHARQFLMARARDEDRWTDGSTKKVVDLLRSPAPSDGDQ